MNDREKVNREFNNLVRTTVPKDLKITPKDYESLLQFSSKELPSVKRVDYGFYAIVIFLIVIVFIILLMIYYTEPKVITAIDELNDKNNISNSIDIDDYEVDEIDDES